MCGFRVFEREGFESADGSAGLIVLLTFCCIETREKEKKRVCGIETFKNVPVRIYIDI